MNRSVLRKIARENGVSVAEVRREIELAIDAAYIKPNAAALFIPRKNAVPTLEEFINYCVGEITPRPSSARILQ